MKRRTILSWLTFLCLSGAVLTACTQESNKESKSSEVSSSKIAVFSTKDSTSEEKSSGFDANDYLTIDTSELIDFKLSDLVKDAVGTYSGVAGNVEYQVRINKDGTYSILSRSLLTVDEYLIRQKPQPYLDASGKQSSKMLDTTINGQLYEFSNIVFTRGVVVERYGQLYFAPLSSQKLFPYLDQNGEIDFTKGLIVKANGFGNYDKLIGTSADYETFLKSVFNYPRNVPEPASNFVIDSGKFTIDNTEISKSSNVDKFLTTDLADSFSEEKVLSQIDNANDILQYVCSRRPEEESIIKVVTDFSKVYITDNETVNADYGITIVENNTFGEKEEDIYVYYKGEIYYGKNVNGRFVLSEKI